LLHCLLEVEPCTAIFGSSSSACMAAWLAALRALRARLQTALSLHAAGDALETSAGSGFCNSARSVIESRRGSFPAGRGSWERGSRAGAGAAGATAATALSEEPLP
jgi:hypothetical protein